MADGTGCGGPLRQSSDYYRRSSSISTGPSWPADLHALMRRVFHTPTTKHCENFSLPFLSSFSLFQSRCCPCSLLLSPSTCHVSHSASALRLTGRLLVALNLLPCSSPALSWEVASHQHLSATVPPRSHFLISALRSLSSLLTAPRRSEILTAQE